MKQENKEPKNQSCYMCEKFSGYYTKGLMRFVRSKLGYCREHKKIVENSESCECWRNNCRRLYVSKKTSLKVLSNMLNDISGIRQILDEAKEDMGKNEQ